MKIWISTLLVGFVLVQFVDGRCLVPKDGSRKFYQYLGKTDVISIDSSFGVTHNVTSNVLKIVLEDVLNYDSAVVVQKYPRSTFAAIKSLTSAANLHPEGFVNMEVRAELDFSLISALNILDLGVVGPSTSLGWFSTVELSSWKNLTTDAAPLSMSKEYESVINKLSEEEADRFGEAFCTRNVCPTRVHIPDQCVGRKCSWLLVGDIDNRTKLVLDIKELKLMVNVAWLGYSLADALDSIPKSVPVMILGWYPDEMLGRRDHWYPVPFPPCVGNPSKPGCLYQSRRRIKLVSDRLKFGAPYAYEAISEIKFDSDDYSYFLNEAVINRSLSHYDIACSWLQSDYGKKIRNLNFYWKSSELPVLEICGIFPISGMLAATGNVERAALLAAQRVNDNHDVLPNHKLEIKVHDGQCKSDRVMNIFIDYILESNARSLVGILGPACSETVEPLVGLTKFFRTVVISYSAEGSTFSNRHQYPNFFRTIGDNQQYKFVYLELLKQMGWRRMAALTEEGQKYTEYLSHLEYLFQTNNYQFIAHRKFPKNRDDITMRAYLEGFHSDRARIIIADVYDYAARTVMCEAYKLNMTASEGYVWFLPQWLSKNWYDTSFHRPSEELVNCTRAQMLKAIQGHFSLAHRYLAPDNETTHEGNLTVKEWKKEYRTSLGDNETESNYAGYAYDAVWTYAYALDKLYRTNQSYLSDIHSINASEKFVELIQTTSFSGVSGRIQFGEASSRMTVVNILQWIGEGFVEVGHMTPNASFSSKTGGSLFLDKSKIQWFTADKKPPTDGGEASNCMVQGLADFLQVECSVAIIAANIIFFGLLAIVLIIAVAFTKRRYDKKVQKLQQTHEYMRHIGLDVLPNLLDVDKWEIPRDHVVINRRLGEGAFGTVYGGEAFFKESGWTAAAVKTLKVNSTTEQKLEFLGEAEVMKRFDHKNIVKLLGVCTRDEPVYTVMEFMLYGDLKTFLLNRRHLVSGRRFLEETNEVSSKKLTNMALDIARGLSYLAVNKYVHRDLACRNCLLNSARVAKIGDFGLTRPMFESDYYKFSRKGMLPIRWMAPESLADGIFTPSSDVWAFGVVLYEIVTFGSYPFQGLSNNQVVEHVKAGNILTIPKGVKVQLECLIKSCWNRDYKKRPAASAIVEFLANNPRLLTPCLDAPASSVAVDDSGGLGLELGMRPSAPASPLDPAGNFFQGDEDPSDGTHHSPPGSSHEIICPASLHPDPAKEHLLSEHGAERVSSPTPSEMDRLL